jgi:DNA-binding XRE family transcriptional regulator
LKKWVGQLRLIVKVVYHKNFEITNNIGKKMEKEENIVKRVCKELGLTYKQLGEKIGVSEATLKSVVSTNKVSLQIQKAIELYIETEDLKKELKEIEQLKIILKNLTK